MGPEPYGLYKRRYAPRPTGSSGINLYRKFSKRKSLCRCWSGAVPRVTIPLVSSLTPSGVSTCIRVKVLFFGRLKEIAGAAEQTVEVTPGSRIEDLFAILVTRRPEFASYRSSVVASRNQEFVAWSTPLDSGDEVAFLPPVSGG